MTIKELYELAKKINCENATLTVTHYTGDTWYDIEDEEVTLDNVHITQDYCCFDME